LLLRKLEYRIFSIKFFNKNIVMAKSSWGGKRKGAGRPETGAIPVRQVRMPDSQVKAVIQWAKKQADKPTFSEAVRRLLAKALS